MSDTVGLGVERMFLKLIMPFRFDKDLEELP